MKILLKHSRGISQIYVGPNISKEIKKITGKNKKRAFVILDRSLTKARREFIQNLKKNKWQVSEIPVRAGESLKDHKASFKIYDRLLKLGAKRDDVVFALGGGSVGDAAGFVASTYLRGLEWVGVPTTLLAQVDSSIGGKTAINHPAGKNLIGTFWQPTSIFSDVGFLKTLSAREMVSGLGEVLKYGLIYDEKFYDFIKKNWSKALRHDLRTLTKIVYASALFKAKTVARDEFDKKGKREDLNFGHTIGHALENLTRYRVFRHGEAVIWGMRFALALSEVKCKMTPQRREKIDAFLKGIKVPPWPKNLHVKDLLKPLSQDKKNRVGKLHFVLLKNFGQTVTSSDVTTQDLQKAFDLIFLA